jgi:hypothetical protein
MRFHLLVCLLISAKQFANAKKPADGDDITVANEFTPIVSHKKSAANEENIVAHYVSIGWEPLDPIPQVRALPKYFTFSLTSEQSFVRASRAIALHSGNNEDIKEFEDIYLPRTFIMHFLQPGRQLLTSDHSGMVLQVVAISGDGSEHQLGLRTFHTSRQSRLNMLWLRTRKFLNDPELLQTNGGGDRQSKNEQFHSAGYSWWTACRTQPDEYGDGMRPIFYYFGIPEPEITDCLRMDVHTLAATVRNSEWIALRFILSRLSNEGKSQAFEIPLAPVQETQFPLQDSSDLVYRVQSTQFQVGVPLRSLPDARRESFKVRKQREEKFHGKIQADFESGDFTRKKTTRRLTEMDDRYLRNKPADKISTLEARDDSQTPLEWPSYFVENDVVALTIGEKYLEGHGATLIKAKLTIVKPVAADGKQEIVTENVEQSARSQVIYLLPETKKSFHFSMPTHPSNYRAVFRFKDATARWQLDEIDNETKGKQHDNQVKLQVFQLRFWLPRERAPVGSQISLSIELRHNLDGIEEWRGFHTPYTPILPRRVPFPTSLVPSNVNLLTPLFGGWISPKDTSLKRNLFYLQPSNFLTGSV